MSEKKPGVAVILSTYNGERFLKEQMESVLSQKGAEIYVFARDDGSTDATVEILKSFEGRVRVYEEENAGVGNSFMQCLYKTGEEYDYYAFCDQDDVWLDNKLLRAIEEIDAYIKDNGEACPVLYCSNQMLTDAEGNETGLRHEKPLNTAYLQVLNNNLLTGCTMVWNKEMQKLLYDENRRPSQDLLQKRIHDVWVAMVASVAGKIIYDENAYIRYRQHESNVVGSEGTGTVTGWKKKLKDPSLRNGRSTLAREILEKYSDVINSEDIKEKLGSYAYYRSEKRCRKVLLKENIGEYSGESGLSVKAKIWLKLV